MSRLRHRLRLAGLTTLVVLVVAAMTAPLAVALESTDSTIDDTTETTEDTTTDTTDDSTTNTTEDTTSTVDDTSTTDDGTLDDTVDDTETVDDTVDTVEDTVDETSDELETSTQEVLSPEEEPSEEPTEEPTEEDDSTSGDDDGTSGDAAQDDGADSTSEEPATSTEDRTDDDDARQTRAASRTITLPEYLASRSISPRAWDAMVGEVPTSMPGAPSGPSPDAVDRTAVFGDLPDLSGPLFGVQQFAAPPGGRSTHDILERLASSGADIATAADVLAPFPVIGPATYGNDWHAPRDGGARLHKGTDIFAQRGTPVAASFDGAIGRIWVDANRGGNAFTVRADDGTYAYYAHLEAFVPGLSVGKKVQQGDILGYVGDSGNAVGTPPHLHFELHPNGGPSVPPLPYLDQWLSAARAEVQLIGGSTSSISTSLEVPPFEPYALPQITSPGVEVPAVDAPAAGPAATSPQASGPSGLDTAPVRRTSDAATPLLTLLSLTLCFWYFVLRGREQTEPATEATPSAPDTLAPFLVDEGTLTASTSVTAQPSRDVLAPLLADEADERTRDDEPRDVLAGIL